MLRTTISLYLLVALSVLASADDPEVSVTTFRERGVVGNLGVPLGKVVQVEGTCYDGGATHIKRYKNKTVVLVTTVDGKKLLSPVLYLHPAHHDDLPAPPPGSPFRQRVFEYGEFEIVGKDQMKKLMETEGLHYASVVYRPKIFIVTGSIPKP